MNALDRVARMTKHDPEDTGGGVRAITYPSPARPGYVVEVSEHGDERVNVAVRHLDGGDVCACDDGAGIWTREAVEVDDVRGVLLDAVHVIVRHICEVSR